MRGTEYFISGIDTDCGKTYITGLLAKELLLRNKNVITTKLVQTGCAGISEDILAHRQAMGIAPLPEDTSRQTCPYVFNFPASPHLSARMEKTNVDSSIIRKQTDALLSNYEIILSEGAGGIMVPLREDYFTLDYIKDYNLPLILVTSSKLGSINHTLLSINTCLQNDIQLHSVVFNQFPNHDTIIASETLSFLGKYLQKHSPTTQLIDNKSLHEIEFN